MTDVTISEFAKALRGELRAEMREHRTLVDAQLREVNRKLDEHAVAHARVESQLGELVTAVTRLTARDAAKARARERRAQAARAAVKFISSTPGVITGFASLAGAIAGAIALL